MYRPILPKSRVENFHEINTFLKKNGKQKQYYKESRRALSLLSELKPFKLKIKKKKIGQQINS